MAYLGYDPEGLARLLGALEELAGERFHWDGRPSRCVEDVIDHHRRSVASLTAFAEPIAAVLHGDPLGRYRGVCLDPTDLRRWALHRGGRWRTVTDPTPSSVAPRDDLAVVNARLLARELTRERLHQLLRSGPGVSEWVTYLASLATDHAARHAFLDTLGPERFARLLDEAGDVVVGSHQVIGSPPPVAVVADQVLSGLAGAWAVARKEDGRLDRAWDHAALAGSLYAASRTLEIAAATPGALRPDELAAWGRSVWQRLLAAFGTSEAPWPSLVGDHLLGALARDGRAARTFVLDLATNPTGIGALLTNVATSPERSGQLLLASTDPTTVRSAQDDDEVRRSLQAVLRFTDRLLRSHQAWFPQVSAGHVEAPGSGWVLPTDLGTYAGRYAERMVDPRDGLPVGRSSIAAGAWPGWREREVAHLLGRLARDPLTAAQLHDATIAGFLHHLGTLDLTSGDAEAELLTGAYAVAAVGALLRDRELERVIRDHRRFEQLVAGADLVVTTIGIGGPGALVVPAESWAWASRLAGVSGRVSPGSFVLSPFQPRSVREALAHGRAAQAVEVAVLKQVTASVALVQLHAAGCIATPLPSVPLDPEGQVTQLVGATRPGDNANAAAEAYLDRLDSWLEEHRDEAAAKAVEQLLHSVGDAATQGAGWVA